jgi:hypothetical protein
MRLKAIRNFRMADRVRGTMVERKIDEVFDVDVSNEKDAQDAYALLQAKRAILVDPAYIPASAKYIVLHAFSYKTKEGFSRSAKSGDEIELNQDQAAQWLISGHVKPADPNQWTIKKLLGLNIDKEKIKRMYDEPISEKENWIMKGREK